MIAIKTENLCKAFKETNFKLTDINLAVEEGEFFALLGPNGSGKTTLINIILTILIPDKGKVKILGKNPFKEKEVLQLVNYVPAEKPRFFIKLKDFLSCYAKLYGASKEKVEKSLLDFKLIHLKENEGWTLSTGELSKAALAKALLNEPRILILDEPTFGLDPKTKREIHSYFQELNKKGVTIFLASHDMVEVERLAQRIAFIKSGRILSIEEKDEILKKFKSLEDYWLKVSK
jgi:ABC-2 type transport system ATP-binding protein